VDIYRVDGNIRIITYIELKRIMEDNIKRDFKNRMGGCELDLLGSGKQPMVGSCEYSNEPSVPIVTN
jgi:hypothetical protein